MSDFDWSKPLDAAIACPLLESLSLYGIGIEVQDWPRCWSLWTGLTSLLLEDYDFHSLGNYSRQGVEASFFEGLPTTRITKLELIRNCGLQDDLVFLKLCPELETFIWYPGDQRRQWRHLTEQARHCPKLVNFTLNIASEKKEETLFLESRASINPLRVLSLKQGNSLGDSFYQTGQLYRQRLALSIRVLNIGKTPESDSRCIQEILCSLPRLDVFSAEMLMEKDTLDDPRPWICQGLSSLTIDIVPTATSSQAGILDRIAGLKFLRTLDFSFGRYRLSGKHLTFRRDYGLDKLIPLRHLTCLKLPKASQDMAKDDIQWVLETWPQLMEFSEFYYRDPKTNKSTRFSIDRGVIYGT